MLTADEVPECSCSKCQVACTRKPGWFRPGEAERTAEHLGISLAELFATKLGVDWFEDGVYDDVSFESSDVFVLAPALVGEPAGEEYPGNPDGRCVFYVDGRCEIHAAKPFECAALSHTDSHFGVTLPRHRAVAEEWVDHQGQTRELLGREPEAESYVGGFLGDLLGGY